MSSEAIKDETVADFARRLASEGPMIHAASWHQLTGLFQMCATEIDTQAARIAELEAEREKLLATVANDTTMVFDLCAERDQLRAKLEDLQSVFDYTKERRAQISHRLWVWAHEELSEPLKTRYFNIVANGTADVMEQPTYAQQYNGMKHRAEAAENERDQLRAEVERLRKPLTDDSCLDRDAVVGAVKFRKGVPVRLVVEAAIRQAEYKAEEAPLTKQQMIEQERNRRALWDKVHGKTDAATQAESTRLHHELMRKLDASIAWLERGESIPGASACIGLNDIKALKTTLEGLA